MPVFGERIKQDPGTSYMKHPIYPYAKQLCETAEMIVESGGVDLFEEPRKLYRKPSSAGYQTMKRFFMENSVDTANPMYTPEEIEDKQNMMEETFISDTQALLEHKAPGDLAPMIGMAAPIHKLIMLNCVFATSDGIQKCTAISSKFTITMERRFLVTPRGERFDLVLDQNKLTDEINKTNPVKDIELTLPVQEDLDIISTYFGGSSLDNLDITTKICAVEIENVQFDVGDFLPDEEGYVHRNCVKATEQTVKNMWMPVDIRFTPNYGRLNHFERTVTMPLTFKYKDGTAAGAEKIVTATITGTMHKNRFNIQDINPNQFIKKIRLRTKLDSSNAMLETCKTDWERDADYVEIGSGVPISVTFSPDEVKDTAVLYNENVITKHMGSLSDIMINYKNDMIKSNLDDSYLRLDERNGFYETFDFAPPVEYALSPLEWRSKMFMDFLNRLASRMYQVLNDPNFTMSVFGDPLLIEAITPKEYKYASSGQMGPVKLNHNQVIIETTTGKYFNLIGADNLRNTYDLIIVLKPHNSERITYRIYDWDLFISTEIGNITNLALPDIYAYERWAFYEYQPVQGRVHVDHPSGIRS